MNHLTKLASAFALTTFCAAFLVLPHFAATQAQQQTSDTDASDTAEPVPAFHSQPPAGELPPTVNPAVYTDKLAFNAYVFAGRIRKVIYQQPCYCHCDRAVGHGSLLDCYVSQHGSRCDICQKEVFYAYEQTRGGKSPAQIRAAIIRGDWRTVDLAKYEKDYLPLPKPKPVAQ
ncbi:MAG: CYCXC family (seleno)protein [Candidatus Acidiferrum sp.]